MTNIHPVDVRERLKRGEKLNIVDVREDEEVATGKIPGAKHIRLNELTDRWQEISPDEETIIVCRSGNRSDAACQFLYTVGYRNVKNMMGGMNNWEGDVEK
ncbi:rhodanese-like domain-containing protein [Brevibacillus parabrevis]|uniref:rhodanese-like domain-containing protein n=1 Tax=Brevibacillus parabrevis TaxID=54914 RepID=UPI0009FBC187|nr:rhodanese-like domain-containing protein [Brevibacillus parabrevis]